MTTYATNTTINLVGSSPYDILEELNNRANPDELFLNLHHNIFLSIYRYKTVEEFVRERFLEEEQKKAEQETEYEQYLTLKEKYDS